ncbi:MAG: aminotransferase class I/II-fold pyridoxal phosphate-dependent enzyme [Candidatus Latescibacteria bacterium]|nr:aminotransferase class I/II-fold pyridoxal phosphate-dependent enzyme [Candidatus Latescibacterota bacterium]NIM66301.1 aminotransferase class I/II-fold pyridoxal phosphate-dependent enzyme [Candidatus Latescibacterota bacterium]NIO02780.1 aminotransferase class I/II-fold pyridoxal phosphate-dependent enzyme [Candidatus Latescibacterota bacterium]NIO29915.1 aminotransferase class I/II-fold pyridoxal phosphate-dependent enzyme [Candidatus Latescibacterota bacterium]NIO57529.1 aminotransferase
MATKIESQEPRPTLPKSPPESAKEPARQATGTVAERVSRVATSPTLRITGKAKAMAAEGIDVIDLSVGEPDFSTPDNIKLAGKQAIDDNFTHYTANDGIPELKRAISDRLKEEHGLEYGPGEIIVSSGAKNCLYNLSVALFNKGEEAIIPAPYWVSYPAQVALAKAIPVIVPTKEENGFRLTPDELQSALTFNTKALILNNPCNPTGTAYTREELEPIAEIAADEGIFIIADEIYEKLVYDGFRFASIASISPKVKQRAIIIHGVSKSYAMTGWRIGYAAGPREIIAAMDKVQSHNTSNASSISQMAALEALKGPQMDISMMVSEFQKRRNFMLQKLGSIPGVSCMEPKGAFYLFPNMSAYYEKEYEGMQIRNSYGLAYFLLKTARVAVVPGDAFGADDFIRLSYASSMERIEEAMDRIGEAMSKLEVAKKIARVQLNNTVTKVKAYAETEPELSLALRNALVAEVETHMGHDNYYEWNANISGMVIQLRTNSPHLNDFWMENWYPSQLEADLEPHGILYGAKAIPGREPRAFYNSESRTGVLVNSAFYGQLRSLALGMVTDVGERLFDLHGINGACLDFRGMGIVLIGSPGTGRKGLFAALARSDKARIHSNDYFFVRYVGGEAFADISERKFYVKTKVVEDNTDWVPFLDRSKCENVVTRKEDCTHPNCERVERCRLDRGATHCFSASNISRAMLDPYWLGGPKKYVKRASLKYVFLLRKDPLAEPLTRTSAEEAIRFLEEGKVETAMGPGPLLSTYRSQPFFNPHLLVKTPDRIELQKRQFERLFLAAECFLVNTDRVARAEIERQILDVVGVR